MAFQRASGYDHPHLHAAINSYSQLLEATGRTPEQIRAELIALGQEHGVQLDL